MRIIITDNGKEVINKLYHSQSAPDISNNQSNIQSNNPLISNQNNNNQKNIDSNINSINDESKLPIYPSNISNVLFSSSNNNINLIYPKIIKIKEKNFKIPNSFLKKYEREQNPQNQNDVPIVTQSLNVLSELEKNLYARNHSQNQILLSKINSKLNSANNSVLEESKLNTRLESGKSSSTNIFLPKIKSQYSIGEIINKDCFDKLNKKMKEKIDNQKYDLKIDSKILRKYWSSKDIFDEIRREKNKTIDATNYKLIEYLMKKTSISGNFLKKIDESNEERLNLLNKISGKVLSEKEIEKKFNKRIKEKLENDKIKETLQFREILLKIKDFNYTK